jgi:hypothetical protein
MAITYEKQTNAFNQEIIVRTDEAGVVAFIPTDPANSDYQAYLATLAANSAPQG